MYKTGEQVARTKEPDFNLFGMMELTVPGIQISTCQNGCTFKHNRGIADNARMIQPGTKLAAYAFRNNKTTPIKDIVRYQKERRAYFAGPELIKFFVKKALENDDALPEKFAIISHQHCDAPKPQIVVCICIPYGLEKFFFTDALSELEAGWIVVHLEERVILRA